MDPYLRHALNFYVEHATATLETGKVTGAPNRNAPIGSDEIYTELVDLRAAVEALPVRVFYLASPDHGYVLTDILRAMGTRVLAWQADAAKAPERAVHREAVDRINVHGVSTRSSRRPGSGVVTATAC